MKKILITGASGQLGTTISQRLKCAGHSVFGVDRSESQVTQFVGDYANLDIGELVGQNVTLLHLAAINDLRMSFNEPERFMVENFEKPKAFIEKNIKYISRIIYPSSCSIYAENLSGKIKESSLLEPISPYARSKMMMEEFILKQHETGLLDAIVFRVFNVYGNYGRFIINTHNVDRLIPKLLLSLIDEKRLSIFGSDHLTADGYAIRDYLHIDDLATLFEIAVSQTDYSGRPIFNAATGFGTSVKGLIAEVEKISKKSVATKHSHKRNGDVACRIADVELTERVFGWRSKITLSEGLETEISKVLGRSMEQ